MSYPYDPLTRQYVARLLYEALPALYRVADQPAAGHDPPLESFLEVWAAPLAVVRQNIEELHADLFIDTCEDWVLPYLAEMVGTTLIFPDPATNRRDVRSTVRWRKRKGTPAMLQDLAGALSGDLAATFEGWKLVQLAQDLDDPAVRRHGVLEPMLLRREREVPDLGDPIIAEKVAGPFVDTHHAVDVRSISRRSGRYNPKHVFHYLHPSRFFSVGDGLPADLTEPGDPDLRFAFHPLGVQKQLRARRTHPGDELVTDRVPPLHFHADPGRWFDRDGRFSVRIAGLAAATLGLESGRRPSTIPASPALADGNVSIEVLSHAARRFYGGIRIELVAAPLAGALPDVPDTAPASIDVRARLEVDADEPPPSNVVSNGALDPTAVVMVRLQAVGAASRLFPGADVEISSDVPRASMGAENDDLARDGFLRGALFVRLPATQVDGDRWFYLAADGSVFDAQSAGSGAVDVDVLDDAGARALDAARLAEVGPGAAWPPEPPTADSRAWNRVPFAPGRGPCPLRGGRALRDVGGALQDLAAGDDAALAFALSSVVAGVREYRPMARLAWQGPDPAAATWSTLDDNGVALPAAQSDARFDQLAQWVDQGPPQLQLVARFECADDDAFLAPSEVSVASGDGRALLVHLPGFTAQPGSPAAAWATDAGTFTGASEGVFVGQDGSTWRDGTDSLVRRALGQVAPLAGFGAVRRRRPAYRSLCQWQHEDPVIPLIHEPTRPGWLDIDPRHGLFALALVEPPQPLPDGPDGTAPPSLTVEYQQGSTAALGALPLAREPLLDRRLATPTRLVGRGGALHRGAPVEFWSIPRYPTLEAALVDVAAAPAPEEVIQFEDSSTYPGESVSWPAGCDRLVIQAAEEERPVIEIQQVNLGAAAYERIELLGLSWRLAGAAALDLPASVEVDVAFCTVLDSQSPLLISGPPAGVTAAIESSLLAAVELGGAGEIRVHGTVLDAGRGAGGGALTAPGESRAEIERSTVFGAVEVRVIEASEVYFDDRVEVRDRFDGCVRYSRVTLDSILPRRHRVVVDTPATFVSVDRHDPAHARLAEGCDPAILQGAEDGGEMGAFHDRRLAEIYRGVLTRLRQSTPAGLATAILRLD